MIPFEFTLPQDTLESYVGKHAWIEYKIEAILDIQWKKDITKKVFFNVFAPRNRSSIPTQYKTSHIKKELVGEEDSDMTKKKGKDAYAILDLHGQSRFYPGDTINGKVIIKTLQKIPRRAELTLSAIEQATAKGMKRTTARESHRQAIEIKEKQQEVAAHNTLPFEIQIPPEAKRTYIGKYSAFLWMLDVRVDIPKASDLNVRTGIEVV
jgi:hypothetical protein